MSNHAANRTPLQAQPEEANSTKKHPHRRFSPAVFHSNAPVNENQLAYYRNP
jgi:hypothetical protein